MRARPVKLDPPKRRLRYFAWIVALGLAVVAWFLDRSAAGVWLQIAAAIVFATGTVLPGLYRPLYLLLRGGSRWLLTRLLPPVDADS